MNPIRPSTGPRLDVILRTPTGSPHQNLFPEPLDLSLRFREAKHAATVHQDTSGHAPPFGRTPQGSHQPSRRDTWVRTWGVKRSRTPRGHTHNQGTSQGQGHLGDTPAPGHTSGTRTPAHADTGQRNTPLGHGHLQRARDLCDSWVLIPAPLGGRHQSRTLTLQVQHYTYTCQLRQDCSHILDFYL